jgi:hypothetical protein
MDVLQVRKPDLLGLFGKLRSQVCKSKKDPDNDSNAAHTLEERKEQGGS